jgi:hypothetical protein
MAKPVVVMTSGGQPVVNVTGATPATPVSSGGVGITLVNNLGVPMSLVNVDGTAWSDVGIFGFAEPETPPTTFPGTLLVGTERTGADSARWSKQSGDAALTIGAGAIAASGAQIAARYWRYTDETSATLGDRIAMIARVESVSGGNLAQSSNFGTPSGGNNTKLAWKGGTVDANSSTFPSIGFSFAAGVSGSISDFRGTNITTLLGQKWFMVVTAGQSNWIGATALNDPDLDPPVEGVVVYPGATNTWSGSTVSVPMACVDPVNHQTLNGSSGALGGGPSGSFLRELRKYIPGDYTIVYCATNYAGQGFKLAGLWNTASAATARNGFWTRVREVWALAPANSVVGGLIFCGGESDLGPGNVAEMLGDGGMPSFFDDVRDEPGWGDVPIVISEIGMAPGTANLAGMFTAQRKFATGSGDPLELTRCTYVARPADAVVDVDDTHYVQATHRQRGIDVALALRDLIYP